MTSQANQRNDFGNDGRRPESTDYLRPSEAAKYTGHSESTLAKLRMQHKRACGPVFIKRGGVVLYRRADLDAWLNGFVIQ
ncbi:Helix-turn-helix domain-containing protein [Jannaschia seohaensis]|uniref:Helix-turn-helix domain-containing protein n=2 Tax=Jannaschia seohaensis TaxID=475081 RepID=A0A2Y9ABQ6_9RHOB|nr:helix-turn-helix domain-containing protein [Jannaschia seohaensis]PWJ21425.1 helix-turn-helix protein [Jannaschia seohaensis]SSA42031.1 Helix-turn-helix domain-containing protein [Jannaschia seohaensis]